MTLHKKGVFILVNYDRIKEMAKKQGVSLSFLAKKLDMYPSYISDAKNKGLDLPDERIQIIADILNCSKAYLKGESDNSVDDDLLDNVIVIDDDLLQKCGDIYHAKIAQIERDRSLEKDQKEKPSAKGELDELDNEIIRVFSSLSDEKKKAALEYLAFLKQQENGDN